MGLVRHVFKSQIQRFNKAKNMTKDSKKYIEDELDSEDAQEDEFGDFEDDEKNDIDPDEFAQNNLEALSDLVPSDKEEQEELVSKTQQNYQSSQHVKSVFKELEDESSSDEEGSEDSLLSGHGGERKVSNRAGINK